MAADRHFTAKDIGPFWEAKGVNPHCELCGHDNWGVVDGQFADTTASIPFAAPDGDPLPFAQSVPVFVVRCDRCGNVRMHARAVLLQWKAEQ